MNIYLLAGHLILLLRCKGIVMSTIDLSRDATDFKKLYAGVRMQQGRVLDDQTANEQARIIEEDARRTRVDTIGTFVALGMFADQIEKLNTKIAKLDETINDSSTCAKSREIASEQKNTLENLKTEALRKKAAAETDFALRALATQSICAALAVLPTL